MKRIVCEYGALSGQRCRRTATVLIRSDIWRGGSYRCEDHRAVTIEAMEAKHKHRNITIEEASR